MDWIVEFIFVAWLWAIVLRLCWVIGSYEATGRRGWRRIPAGAVLASDLWRVRINRWIAQNRRRDG